MEDNKTLKVLKAFLLTSGLIVWYYGVTLIISYTTYLRIGHIAGYKNYIHQNQNMLMVITYLMTFLGIWAFDQDHQSFINAFKEWQFKKTVKYILTGVGVYVVSVILIGILLPFFPDYSEIQNQIAKQHLLLGLIGTAILPPIVEEYLFRHKIQGYLKEGFGDTKIAIIGQAILFGLLHGFVIQKIYAFLFGCFFGWVREKEGTVKYTIVMHMTVNLIGWVLGVFFT